MTLRYLECHIEQCKNLGLDMVNAPDVVKARLFFSLLAKGINLDSALKKMSNFGITFALPDDFDLVAAVNSYGEIIRNLGPRMRDYTTALDVEVVKSWEYFSETMVKHIPLDEEYEFRSLAILFWICTLGNTYYYVSSGESVKQTPYEYFLSTADINVQKRVFNCTEIVFVELWDSVWCFPTKHIAVRMDADLKEVVEAYDRLKVPHAKILSDYAVLRTMSDDFPAINQWQYIQGKIKNSPVEGGVFVDEGLFNAFATRLRKKASIEVVKALFYSNIARNDSGFEVGVLCQMISARAKTGDTVLAVNPSPFIIEQLAKALAAVQANLSCVVTDRVLSSVYRVDLPNVSFYAAEEDIPAALKSNLILVTSRDLEEGETHKFLRWVKTAECGSMVITFIPEKVTCDIVRQGDTCFDGLELSTVCTVPGKAINSHPKRKVLSWWKKTNRGFQTADTVTIVEGGFDSNKFRVESERTTTIRRSELVESNKSLRKLLSKKTQSISRKPSKAQFSAEIEIRYSISKMCDGRWRGRAYYCSLREGQKRGKRVTGFIEAGLRKETRDEVQRAVVETIAFHDRVAPFITQDILSAYSGREDALSLKSLWFCLRDSLLYLQTYNDLTAKELFSSADSKISALVPSLAQEDDYSDAIEEFSQMAELSSASRYWTQLNLLLNAMVKKGFLEKNPIANLLQTIQNRETKAQKEVRNSLVKRTFTLDEEKKMLASISEETTSMDHGRRRKLYEINSHALIGPIRMYSGIHIREVCALTWGDLVEVPLLGLSEFNVFKAITDEGVVEEMPSAGNAIRRIPLVPELATMLQKRREYLQEVRNIPSQELATMPIILATERSKKKRCLPKDAVKVSNEFISAAGIKENLVLLPDENGGKVTDLNRYYGDIFRTNFNFKAINVAGFNQGEVNHILGIKAPDTFSAHYCDYANDFVQSGMARKLHRWAILHKNCEKDTQVKKTKRQLEKVDSKKYCCSDSCVLVDRIVSISPSDKAEKVTVQVSAQYGFNGKIDFIKEGNDVAES